uniref:Uncharacterized protein n=1 Tax=Globodera rostochiensis TaxID=31243 RepID=A0A914HS60_GLORO
MKEFWNLILVSFFATNSLDKAESVQLDEKPYKIIDEIFGKGWWDNEKDKEWHKLTLEHVLHQIDRQNTQIGQIEPNSTDQNTPFTESDHSGQIDEIFGEGWWDNDKAKEWDKLTLEQNALHQIDRQNTQIGQIEPNSTDQLGQIKPNSTDQNPPFTESDHSGQIEPNSTDQNHPFTESDHSGQIEPNSTDQNPSLTVARAVHDHSSEDRLVNAQINGNAVQQEQAPPAKHLFTIIT